MSPVPVTVCYSHDDPAYADIVARSPDAMIYQDPAYLQFLQAVLPDAERRIFVIPGVAALPICLRRTDAGAVVNALPYYGSHGDIIHVDPADGTAPARLLAALAEYCADQSVDAVNIVAHPLRPVVSDGGPLRLKRWDEREGQISHLLPASTREEALAATLAACNGKTRNLARKGLAQSFEISVSDTDEDWRDLALHHRKGIEALGGQAKLDSDFEELRRCFSPSRHARLYVAHSDGVFAGGLLVLRYRNWAEYFTPVAAVDFRQAQVVPALIATAMADARMDGARLWNWGGTWRNQDGVRHFKEGWGAQSYPYGYFGAMLTDRLVQKTPAELIAEFPRFYVRPFANAEPVSDAS